MTAKPIQIPILTKTANRHGSEVRASKTSRVRHGTVANKNPDASDFEFRFAAGNDAGEWLAAATERINQLCDATNTRYIEGIDREVVAAIKFERQLRENNKLHTAWCSLPTWSMALKKRPRPGNKADLLEQVFRYIWALLRGDQDGYELRYRAVKRYYQPSRSPDRIVLLIRESGGYAKAGKGGQGKPDSFEDIEPPAMRSSKAATPDASQSDSKAHDDERKVPCMLHFASGLEFGKTTVAWWEVSIDLKTKPPTVFVASVQHDDLP